MKNKYYKSNVILDRTTKYYYKYDIYGNCLERCHVCLTGRMIGSSNCQFLCRHNRGRGETNHWIKCNKLKEAVNIKEE